MEINNKYAYVRVSSKSQELNSSIESQKQQLIQNGIEEENIFVEVESAANEIKNRSVFQKLINQKLKEKDLLMKRLETGTYTPDDVTWIKHECA
jgi:DNA invertase Pin-like site-specific DNA recombinase